MADAKRTSAQGTPRCQRCGYSLGGSPTLVCSECGAKFDPNWIDRKARRMRFVLAALVLCIAMYAPYAWLVMIDYPWSEYRWSWIAMWPGMPVLFIAHVLGMHVGFEIDGAVGRIVIDAIGVALWLCLAVLVKRSLRLIMTAATIIGVLSALNSWVLYHGFRM